MELECSGSFLLFMTTPVLHGAVTCLMVDMEHMTREEAVTFGCLLSIFGFRELDYGACIKL